MPESTYPTLVPPEISVRWVETSHDDYFETYKVIIQISNPNSLSDTQFSARVRVWSQEYTLYNAEITEPQTIQIDLTDYPESNMWHVEVADAIVTWRSSYVPDTIADVTETVGSVRMRPVSVFDKSDSAPSILLKAFCNFQGANHETVYGRWECSDDGITWDELRDANRAATYESISAKDIDYQYDVYGNVVIDEDVPTAYTDDLRYFYKLAGNRTNATDPPESPKDHIKDRYDCILYTGSLLGRQIRFRMVTVETVSNTNRVKLELGRAIYIPMYASKTEVLDSDFPSASLGTPLYHNRTLYTYGVKSEQAIVYASEVGSLVRPLSRVLDLDSSSADVVTALIPWRDYLIAATEHSLHLIMRSGTGFTSKIINPSIGIPVEDSRCCVPVLNGVIFKSGNRIFQLYPNIYSGEDTVLNVSDLSKPISTYSLSADRSFAFSSEEAYYLMLTKSTETECWKYNYVFKTWMRFKYPIVSYGHFLQNISNIKLYGYSDSGWGTFVIERELNDLIAEFDVPTDAIANLLYGDYVRYRLDQLPQDSIGEPVVDPDSGEVTNPIRTPIPYTLDSGQKIDNISYTKQFTEAKFVFVTEHNKDRFPCEVLVHIDGDIRIIKINVNTDSAFWVSATNFASEPLTLGTAIYSEEANLLNTFRHLFLRYSGKGRSIRFKLTGNSVYRFRIHSILSRYRTLNVKQ